MTIQSHEKLTEELYKLKTHDRHAASKAIEIARAHGDLSENAEYDAAKEAQGMLEARIRLLENKIATAQVIDIAKLSGEKVIFGATVLLEDADTGEEKKITIVGDEESDAANGLISFASPLARSVIGKTVGESAIVNLPAGKKEYEVMEVEFVVPP